MLAMNKNLSKQIFVKNNIKTPNFFYIDEKNYSKISLANKIKINKLTFPIVIKPNDEGSSIGVKICKNLKVLKSAFKILKKI